MNRTRHQEDLRQEEEGRGREEMIKRIGDLIVICSSWPNSLLLWFFRFAQNRARFVWKFVKCSDFDAGA